MKLTEFRLALAIITFLVLPSYLQAQLHRPVHPDLSGDRLLSALVDDYKPQHVLDYRSARELMYTSIYNENDSVRCVYSGYSLYLPPDDNNPVGHLLKFGSLKGIITEHTYPRSKGAKDGNAKSDMHHLFPARLGVNISRLNHPFGEIPDQLTESWYYLDEREKEIPQKHIEWYSEKGDDVFEPREDHKGNVARAIFYFYAMYKDEALNEDPEFFELQRPTLCQWHYQDPVDQKEWDRTFMIAEYQDGKPNPFVLDCSLVARTYCRETLGQCSNQILDTSLDKRLQEKQLVVHKRNLEGKKWPFVK